MKNNDPIVMEQTFPAPAERVWKALTDKDEMKKWYFDLTDFRPEVGFKFQFLAGDDKKKWLHLCKVTEVVPGRKIAYDWRYDGHPGNSNVAFELFAEGNKTRLKLTHTGLETFPTLPEFAKQNFVHGWTHLIGTSLKDYLQQAVRS